MDAKQTAILNGLMRDGHIHSWAIVYDNIDDYCVDLGEALTPNRRRPADAYTCETLPWWLLADDWDPKS